MPTENRSSTIEQHDHIDDPLDMVSVPRAWLNSVALLQMPLDELQEQAIQHLCEPCDEPVPEPHPEPIAWMVGTAIWWTKEEAERDAAATGLPVVAIGPMPTRQDEPAWFMTEGGVSAMHAKAKAMSDQQGLDTSSYCVPLYTHADPAEVDRLRAERDGLKLAMNTADATIDDLTAAVARRTERVRELESKLAEAHALLREWRHGHHHTLKSCASIIQRTDAALSASAEPSAPDKQGSSLGAVRAPEIQDLLDRAATAIGQYGDSLLGRGQREDSVDLLDLEREVRDLEQQFKGAFAQPST